MTIRYIFKEIDKFIKSKNRNILLIDNKLTIYIRFSFRLINGELVRFLDIANISILEKHQNKGIFTSLINFLIINYPNINIYVECIHNNAIIHVLKKFKFLESNYEWQINMYKFGYETVDTAN